MLRNSSQGAVPFHEPHHHASRSRQPDSAWPPVIALRAMWEAFHEGLAAHRRYERLRAAGMVHDKALRESIGFGTRRVKHTTGTSKSLYWAGRA